MGRRILKYLLIGLVIVILIGVSIIGAAIGYDIYLDRQRQLKITGQIRLFEEPYPLSYPGKENHVVAILNKGDRVEVRRIWYGKDYMVIKVRLADGREGYLIPGDSGVDYKLSE